MRWDEIRVGDTLVTFDEARTIVIVSNEPDAMCYFDVELATERVWRRVEPSVTEPDVPAWYTILRGEEVIQACYGWT